MEGISSGMLSEGGVTMGVGQIGSIVLNIWIAIILMLILIAAGILTTITTASMATEPEPLTTSWYILIASSVLAWLSAIALLILIAVVLIFTEGLVILYAPFTIIILAIVIAILCIVIATLNMFALGNSYGSLPFEEGQYAGIGASLAAMGAIVGIGFFIVILALKKQKEPSIETVIIV
jgi:hypothetical protein